MCPSGLRSEDDAAPVAEYVTEDASMWPSGLRSEDRSHRWCLRRTDLGGPFRAVPPVGRVQSVLCGSQKSQLSFQKEFLIIERGRGFFRHRRVRIGKELGELTAVSLQLTAREGGHSAGLRLPLIGRANGPVPRGSLDDDRVPIRRV